MNARILRNIMYMRSLKRELLYLYGMLAVCSACYSQQVSSATVTNPDGPSSLPSGGVASYSANGSFSISGPPGATYIVELFIGKSNDPSSSANTKVKTKTVTANGQGQAQGSIDGSGDVTPTGTGSTKIYSLMLIIHQNTPLRQATGETTITGFEIDPTQTPE